MVQIEGLEPSGRPVRSRVIYPINLYLHKMAEGMGFEPIYPFGRILSRDVQYHYANPL